MAGDQRHDRRALIRIESGAHKQPAEQQPSRQRRARRKHGEHAAPIELHDIMSLTFDIRSRVENGLVM